MAERRGLSRRLVEKAQERGEVRADIRPELVTEMLSSFAWGRLLTGRLDISDADIDAVIDTVLAGIMPEPAG